MPPRKKKKSSRKASTRPSRPGPGRVLSRRWLRPLLIIAGIGLIVLAGLFVWIDQRVQHHLIERRDSGLAAVYTDMLRITPKTHLTSLQLREELLVRGYTEVSDAPDEPGEFREQSGTLSGVTREFITAGGDRFPQQKFSYPFRSQDQGDQTLILAPRVLAPLLAGEQRAHRYKTLREIPKDLQHAVIAIEDERFYSHMGIDLMGIARAVFINLRALAFVQGGSTLTQQLAKNSLFSRKRAISRKILEALAAISIEWRLPKERILELYLNEVYLGQEGPVAIHGAGAAAMTFFGKPIEELSLGESALIAGMIQAPSAYAPRRHLDRALERRRSVLHKMEELGYISASERQKAELEKPQIVQQKHFERRAPFFVDTLRTALSDSLDLESSSISGLKVYTGINAAIQECAEKAIATGMRQLERSYPDLAKGKRLEAGLLAIDPASGLVRAWVGGRSYAQNQFDHVSLGIRQAGSTVKPFLYLTSLDPSLNQYKVAKATSILPDEPLSVQVVAQRAWEPENYDRKFRGDVTMRYALENSLNLPAVYVSQKVGIDALAHTYDLFKLSSSLTRVPSIALGAIDTTLFRVTGAYGALANGGRASQTRLFSSVVDGDDHLLLQSLFQEQQLASEDAVFVLTHLMRGVLDHGTGHGARALGFTRPAAGKTGTSNDSRDAWFVGFTPSLAAGVWLGYDDNRKFGLTGGKAAVPIWGQFMRCAENWIEDLDFIPPQGVTFKLIDRKTGRLASSECPEEDLLQEAFVEGTEPLRYCPEHATSEELEREERGLAPSEEPPSRPRRRRERGFWESLFG